MRSAALAAALSAVALSCAHTPTAKERESSEAHYNLGLDALRAQDLQTALHEFDESLKLDPGFAEALVGRGLTSVGFGDFDKAEADYRKAIAAKPDYSEAHNDLGQLLAEQGHHAEAVAEFDAALANRLYREPYIARCNKGLALHKMGRRDEGVAFLRACLAENRRYCLGYRELGRIYLQDNDAKQALEQLGEYSRRCGDAADAWYQLGLAHVRAGDVEHARESFQKCETVGKDSGVAKECRKSRELLQ
jgi:Tfp pilus assembly protein PilF